MYLWQLWCSSIKKQDRIQVSSLQKSLSGAIKQHRLYGKSLLLGRQTLLQRAVVHLQLAKMERKGEDEYRNIRRNSQIKGLRRMVCVDSTWISTAQVSVCISIGKPDQKTKNRECAPKGSQRWGWMEQQTADSSQQVQQGTARTSPH